MNKNLRNLLLLGLLLGNFFFFSACKSTKPLIHKSLPVMSFDQLYKKIEQDRPVFSYLSAKLGVSYQKGDKEPVQFRAQMRLKNDSIIWMSIVPAMGIEAARIVLTKDSAKLLNRIKKYYVMGNYHLIDSLMHTAVNFDMMQSLLLGNSISYPLADSSSTIDKQCYLLSMKMKMPGKDSLSGCHFLTQKIWIDPETKGIKELYLSEDGMKNKGMHIFYDAYQNIDGQNIPLKMQIVVHAKQKISIDINFKKTDMNIPRGFPFIVPGKYKKKDF